MSAPRLEACYFNPPDCHFDRLARVLEYSARTHCPDWTVNVREISAPPAHDERAANTRKLDDWAAIVAGAADGDRILLIDVDTMVLRPLDDVWNREFDVAYTVKDGDRIRPFNAGVVFLRVNAASRAFMAAWQRENRRLFENRPALEALRKRYAGMNQPALGSLLEAGAPARLGLRLLQLPCSEWNCEDGTWQDYAPETTRIVHVKSGLRRSALGFAAVRVSHRALVSAWRQLERAAEAAADPDLRAATTARRIPIEDLSKHRRPFVTVRALAAYWGVDEKTVRRYIRKGALRASRLSSGALRIATEDARAFGTP